LVFAVSATDPACNIVYKCCCLLVDVYCCAEVDSFGHFFMKAKTRVADNSLEPVWDAVWYETILQDVQNCWQCKLLIVCMEISL